MLFFNLNKLALILLNCCQPIQLITPNFICSIHSSFSFKLPACSQRLCSFASLSWIFCLIAVVNVWLPYPCHVVAPAILQSLIVHQCSPRGCCDVLAVSECNTAKCSFSAVRPPWEAFDQLRCRVCFRVSLLACSAPWLSGVLSELKPGFLQIVFNRIRRRVHDKSVGLSQ